MHTHTYDREEEITGFSCACSPPIWPVNPSLFVKINVHTAPTNLLDFLRRSSAAGGGAASAGSEQGTKRKRDGPSDDDDESGAHEEDDNSEDASPLC